jgi:hypothetical protein
MSASGLPGKPGRRLGGVWNGMDEPTRAAFRAHLLADTSAEYLADWLRRSGTPVSASTIRTYRRALRPQGRPHK